MLDVRAGLGPDIVDVVVDVKPVGGYAELRLVIQGLGSVSASQLSDGQLSYLALVALAHLNEDDEVLLFDEPELHLNPALLARATWLFERIATQHPVILATHADALLDALESEADSVRAVQLDGQRRTVIRKLSAERLKVWSDRYSGVSELRREGLLSDVVEVQQ